MFETDAFGDDIKKIYPVINEDGSDSAMLDNYLNMLTLSGIPMAQAVMMAIPEPWENDETMDPDKRAFYEYNSTCGEPWDGPAAIAFTDGDIVGATLDRNGLRPARYYVTKDDMLILSSEVGVLDVDDSSIIAKKRLEPGKMLAVTAVYRQYNTIYKAGCIITCQKQSCADQLLWIAKTSHRSSGNDVSGSVCVGAILVK